MKRIGFIDSRRIKGFRFVATSGAGKGIDNEVIYDPVTSGHGTPIGLAGKATLATGKEFSGGVGYMWGVQGQLHFEDGATLDEATSIFSALRGVITASGTPVFTDYGGVNGLYVDNLCAIDLAGISAYAFGSALASLQNHGGTLDHAISLRGGNKITNVFHFDTFGGGAIDAGTKAGAGTHMRILVDGVTKYINIYGG